MLIRQMVKIFTKGMVKTFAIMGIVCSAFVSDSHSKVYNPQSDAKIEMNYQWYGQKTTLDLSKIPTLDKTLQINRERNKGWLHDLVSIDNVKTPRLVLKKNPLIPGRKVVVMKKIWTI